MNDQIINFINPINQKSLRLIEKNLVDDEGNSYPIINCVPRICETSNYTDNFGFQWNQFDQTQLDKFSGSDQSFDRFYNETGWSPNDFHGSNVLEVGSGAGRFSDVLLRTTSCFLYSIDYSTAVEVNYRNNIQYRSRLCLAQASIYQIPFPDNSFDKIFCLGVLQHTPSFEDSVKALIKKTKIGGEVVVDFYPIKGWWTKIHSKYILRPITKRISKVFLLSIIRLNINWMIKFFNLLCKLRLGVLTRFIPITDIRGFPEKLTPDQLIQWAILDTFDAFSPAFDNPQRIDKVKEMFERNGCKVFYAGFVPYPGGISSVVRAKKVNVDLGVN